MCTSTSATFLLQANEQMAALQDQVSDLQQQLAAAKQVAEAAECQRDAQLLLASNLRTELEQAQAEKATLQASIGICAPRT